MKRKLILGLGLALLVFTVGAMTVVKHLDTIVLNQRLTNEQDIIIGKYNEMLLQMKGAQAELYRHQAAYSRNIDELVTYITDFDENIDFLLRQYTTHISDVACMQCHSHIKERLTSISGILNEIKTIVRTYKEDVSIMITTDDESQIRLLENAATTKGAAIIDLLEKAKHGADNMSSRITERRSALVDRSRTIIFLSIFLIFALSLVIYILVIRGVTVPVKSLIQGIRKISAGDFSERVQVQTKDEIGFMADAFNVMAERLSATNEEKDRLLNTLRTFNEELEKKIKEATDRLRLTQENMARTETLAAVGTLAAGISHEISTPLNTIIGYAQLTLSDIDDAAPLKGDLKVIEQEALRCKRIVQGLLNFAKPQRHEERLTDINGLLSDTLSLIEYQPSMRKINIKRIFNRGLSHVEADPLQLKQVFLNIILNAVQAMPEGGELKISTDNVSKGIEALISDTGTGISEEARQKIFQPFYTTKKDGTGLGLSISYGIIKEHGGDIFVESSEGNGTTFKISLPVQHKGSTILPGQEHKWREY